LINAINFYLEEIAVWINGRSETTMTKKGKIIIEIQFAHALKGTTRIIKCKDELGYINSTQEDSVELRRNSP